MNIKATLLESQQWLSTRQIPYQVVKVTPTEAVLAVPNRYTLRMTQLLESYRNKGLLSKQVVADGGTLVSFGTKLAVCLEDIAESIGLKYDGFTKQLVDILGEDQYNFGTAVKSSPSIKKFRKTKKKTGPISQRIDEALDGLGAEYQPDDIIKRLNAAMQKMGLQEKLKMAGINARLSRDRQFITFVKLAGDQPIQLMQLATQDLAESKALEEALHNLLDLAAGQAPGAGHLRREQLKNAEKKVSTVAGAFAADQAQQAQMAQQQMPGMSPMQPDQMQPVQ